MRRTQHSSYSQLMFTIAALYHFTEFDHPGSLLGPLRDQCIDNGITGTLLLAEEGINGTICGTRSEIDCILEYIRSLPGCEKLTHKESTAELPPFARMNLKLKKELVSFGQPNLDPKMEVGQYVEAKDWNGLISSRNVAVIDTRNNYEVRIGTFNGSIDPGTESFRDFPQWWEVNKYRFLQKRIAMFCTGGIRCEKSTRYLRSQGIKEVYHLKGGILKYLEEVPKEDSKWQGECFVFDARVSVGHGLKKGPYQLCYACRRPILPEDKNKKEYEHGVACHHCSHETSETDKNRFRERQKQILLARGRGKKHITGYDGN